jgi:hypothetical protein
VLHRTAMRVLGRSDQNGSQDAPVYCPALNRHAREGAAWQKVIT